MKLLDESYMVKPLNSKELKDNLHTNKLKANYPDGTHAYLICSKSKSSDPKYLPKKPFSSVNYRSRQSTFA